MKTMTCRDLGGPCDLAHSGDDANDVINAQDRHLKEAEKAGDATHQEARDAMKGRWRRPQEVDGLVTRTCSGPSSELRRLAARQGR